MLAQSAKARQHPHQDKVRHGVADSKHKLEGHVLNEATLRLACLHVGGHCLKEGCSDGCGITGHRNECVPDQPLCL